MERLQPAGAVNAIPLWPAPDTDAAVPQEPQRDVASEWPDRHARMAALTGGEPRHRRYDGTARRAELTAYGETLKTELQGAHALQIENELFRQTEAVRAAWAAALVLAGHLEPSGDRDDWRDDAAVLACRAARPLRSQVLTVLTDVLGRPLMLEWQDHPYRLPVCARLMLEEIGLVPCPGESPEQSTSRQAALQALRAAEDAARAAQPAVWGFNPQRLWPSSPAPATESLSALGVHVRPQARTQPPRQMLVFGIANGTPSDLALAALGDRQP